MQARSADEAHGALAWMLRRRSAVTALRGNVRQKLERLEFVGIRSCSSSFPKAPGGRGERSARQNGLVECAGLQRDERRDKCSLGAGATLLANGTIS